MDNFLTAFVHRRGLVDPTNGYFADQACGLGPQNTYLLLFVISVCDFTPVLFNDIELCVF